MANDQVTLESMLTAFEGEHADEGQALRAMLQNTPALAARVQQAVQNGQLTSFAAHASPGGGSYDSQTNQIKLPMGLLADSAMNDLGNEEGNTARIVLGHEIGHALNKAAIQHTNTQFATTVAQIASSPSPHDYTEALRTRGAVQRVRESGDEIAGVNTLIDFVKTQNPAATLETIYNASSEMRVYIDKQGDAPPFTFTAKPGLTFGADLKVAETPANLEAMGQLFYDARGYPQRYGAVGLALISQAEAMAQAADPARPTPVVRADLAGLGIDASQVPSTSLPPGFIDAPSAQPAQRLTDEKAAEPSPADQPLTDRIRNGVIDLEKGLGKTWDDSSERLTASLTVLAKQKGFTERDELGVMFNQQTPTLRAGELVFLHRTGATASADPAANRAHMTTSDALAAPAQARYQQAVDTPSQSQLQPQQLQANLEQAESPSQSKPALQKIQH